MMAPVDDDGDDARAAPASSQHDSLVQRIAQGQPSAIRTARDAMLHTSPEYHAPTLAKALIDADALTHLLTNLATLPFESRKHLVTLFACLLRRRDAGHPDGVGWLAAQPALLAQLLRCYAAPETALNYGAIVRECLRYERLVEQMLPQLPPPPLRDHSDAAATPPQEIFRIFGYCESARFDVASDAFATLCELLTRQRPLVARFLTAYHDDFFARYHRLVRADNYVTRRKSLRLLGDVLLDRSHFSTMTRYIASADNLAIVMRAMLDPSVAIQLEAFHVFKVFVANPRKQPRVLAVLLRNQGALLNFLRHFQPDAKLVNEAFAEDRRLVFREIESLAGQPAVV